jgi:hypothetical protein
MMRQTRKLLEAQKTLKALPFGERGRMQWNASHEELYATLEHTGYYWDSGDQQWHKGDANSRARGQFSGSIFEDGDGLPTGVFKLRVMANGDEIGQVCADVSRALVDVGMSVIDVSDKSYPNRHGAGVRIYLTCKRKDKS